MLYLSKIKFNINISEEELKKLPFKEHTDKDLYGVNAIALRSEDGLPYSFYRSTFPEEPIDYKFTPIYYLMPEIRKLIDSIQTEKTRIRIHKVSPQNSVPLHTDFNNDERILSIHPFTYRMRILTALNEDKNFILKYKKNSKSTIELSLEKGQSIIFDPDYIYHGMENRTKDKDRYALICIIKVNKWLVKEFIGEQIL